MTAPITNSAKFAKRDALKSVIKLGWKKISAVRKHVINAKYSITTSTILSDVLKSPIRLHRRTPALDLTLSLLRWLLIDLRKSPLLLVVARFVFGPPVGTVFRFVDLFARISMPLSFELCRNGMGFHSVTVSRYRILSCVLRDVKPRSSAGFSSRRRNTSRLRR